jgi:hypothetical protein
MSIDTDITETTDTADRPVLETIGETVTPPEHLLEVRRRPGIAAALGVGASLVAVAYLARAAAGGGVVDWLVAGVLAVIGVANLAALLDARTPLLVADDLGVRLRLGRTWVGLPWGGLHEVEHRARRGWWHDGLLVVRTHYVQRVLEDLDAPARRVARLNARLHHTPLAVALGLATKVVGAPDGLTAALRELSDGRTPVVEPEPVADLLPEPEPDLEWSELDEPDAERESRWSRLPDPRPVVAHLIGVVAARLERPARDDDELDDELDEELEEVEPEIRASETPSPARETTVAARAEVRRVPEPLEEETQVWADLHAAPEVEDALLIDDYAAHPATDPVIGPTFAAARHRLGLSVDELADRTRIRPHVIEAIEVDDFSACGGDFYARGHLRTLARVLGVEAPPILATYDDQYADAPIDPRRVFEAELAGAGSIRATCGGPNWSVLVAAVMALVLCWSVARLVTGGPDPADRAVLSGSGGPNHQTKVPVGDPVPVTLTASGGGVHLVVRDGRGALVYSGDLAYGQQHTVRAATPVEVQSTDGSVRVTVAGQERGRMGPVGRPATQSYAARGR